MVRLEDSPRRARPPRPGTHFPWCGKLIVARADSEWNAAGAAIYVLFFPIVFGEDRPRSQNNAGPDMSGTAKGEPRCFDVIV